ncbi:2Fe-2S iron-sulfur cluster-binding protein [Oceanospirillum sediminis]|uniref:2Fe-2S iron-sulfur cluster binding domain-containing protein n=1 Tax=Oceanospirillum sediminis TaxID=2760088 RepID=A0A839IR45_9GAMM|nr:2Fe-2S iron-sulfur cluster-binding protein [Oceanospirillum sediminis]MBB1486969.1 2Fe-2S iron-sulfur cluster binding domain-containing protein [Oceanospirillum sediminis]
MTERYKIELTQQGESFCCNNDESVLHGMARLGIKGIPLGCRGGGCGICKVHVLEGDYRSKVMSRSHISAEEEQDGRVLACRIYPRSDLNIEIIGKMSQVMTRARDSV